MNLFNGKVELWDVVLFQLLPQVLRGPTQAKTIILMFQLPFYVCQNNKATTRLSTAALGCIIVTNEDISIMFYSSPNKPIQSVY